MYTQIIKQINKNLFNKLGIFIDEVFWYPYHNVFSEFRFIYEEKTHSVLLESVKRKNDNSIINFMASPLFNDDDDIKRLITDIFLHPKKIAFAPDESTVDWTEKDILDIIELKKLYPDFSFISKHSGFSFANKQPAIKIYLYDNERNIHEIIDADSDLIPSMPLSSTEKYSANRILERKGVK